MKTLILGLLSVLFLSSCSLSDDTSKIGKLYLPKSKKAEPSLRDCSGLQTAVKQEEIRELHLTREWTKSRTMDCQGNLVSESWHETLGARDDVWLSKYSESYRNRGPIFVALNDKTGDCSVLENDRALKPKLWVDIAPDTWSQAHGYTTFHVEDGSNPIRYQLSICKENTAQCLDSEREVVGTDRLILRVVYKQIYKPDPVFRRPSSCSGT